MDSEEEYEKSRSQLKREFQELKDLVQQLVDLPARRIREAPFTERIRDAILRAQEMERYPLKRQIGYIAGRLQDDEIEAIEAVLSGESIHVPEEVPDAPLSAAEQWGEQLIAGKNDAMTLFVDQHPQVDVQHLRQLVRNAKKERKKKKSDAAATQLLDYLATLDLQT